MLNYSESTIMKKERIDTGIHTGRRASKQRWDVSLSRGDLQQLIHWMEHDRRLEAPPEKIESLKRLLVDVDRRKANPRPVGIHLSTSVLTKN